MNVGYFENNKYCDNLKSSFRKEIFKALTKTFLD